MSVGILINAFGGLAIFLLAMLMMTEGLTVFAGGGLRQLLGRWTSTPLRGIAAGILVTGLVQSSSAVTVATIGFVNAGILTLRQALGVIFGTNVGTTMTAWMVSLLGFGFKIESFALPILTLGVILRLVAPRRRWKGLGNALAGFGLFFLGLAILKEAFAGLANTYSAEVAGGAMAGGMVAFLLVGFVATVLTQSSSAAIAIILTAAAGGVVDLDTAAAAVIGANLGTTSTAAVAVFKATPAAKRLALGHIFFNVLTGIVALLVLPALLWLIGELAEMLGMQNGAATKLALFHTVFNVLGVFLMMPLTGVLAKLLDKLFQSVEEDIGRPRHLDATLAATPALAASALHQELQRLLDIVTGILNSALSGAARTPDLEKQADAVHRLADAIAAFVASLRADTMTEQVAGEMADALYAARHFREAARLSPGMRLLVKQAVRLENTAADQPLRQILTLAWECISEAPAEDQTALDTRLNELRWISRQARKGLLDTALHRQLSVDGLDIVLEALYSTRRALEQLVKGGLLTRNWQKAGTGVEEDEQQEKVTGEVQSD
jgi:phosphate:Na+ symporter